MIFRFGEFELDEEAAELRRAGVPVPVQPKPLALLALLIRERDRVVSQDELFEALWPGTAVTPGSLTRAVSHARRAIDDTHRGALLRSLPRRGYRFTGDVTVHEPGDEASPARIQPAAQAGAPFVGREAALERLLELWSQVDTGRAGVAVVSGPPGIGKTRLTEVFADEVSRRGALVIVSRCRESEGVPAFWLWTQVLRQLTSESSLAEEVRALARSGELSALLPSLSALSPGRGAPRELSPEQQRFLFFDAVTRALSTCSRKRPLVLLLEDVQWAGSASLRLLEHLAFELGRERLLLVVTIRDQMRARGHPADRAVAILGQQERTLHLPLSGLSRRDVAALLERVIGRPAPPELTSELFARTEGVPLFLREALRVLAERGDLAHPERIPRRGITLPGQALQLIRRSLDALSAPCAELIGACSVLGRGFVLPNVAAVAELPRGEVLDLLDEATLAGIVEAVPDVAASYRFTHSLFREAAYEALQPGVRARLHLRAALRLESQNADDPGRVIAELAHHHHHALAVGDPELAYSRALQAAEQAEQLFARDQAVVHYEQAAAALDQCDGPLPERRLRTLLALGEAHGHAGDRDGRRRAFSQAMSSARTMERPREFAEAAIGFCDISEWSPTDETAKRCLEEALAGLPTPEHSDEQDVVQRARLTTRLAYLAIPSGREGAEPIGRESVGLARRSGDAAALQEALYILHYLLAGPYDMAERRELVDELTDLGRRSGANDATIIALLDIACDYVTLGDATGARHTRSRVRELMGDCPSLAMVWHARVYDAGVLLLEGRFDEAEAMARDALGVGKRIQHPYAQACFNGHMALLARERGDDSAVVRLFRPTRRGGRGATFWALAVLARGELALGNEEAAREIFAELAGSGLGDRERGIRWVATMAEIALLCGELGDGASARALCELLSPVESMHSVLPVPINYGGPVAYALAKLHEALGEADEAGALYEEALEAVRRLGARPTRARVAFGLGRLLARHGKRARARELLGESAALADELGMATVEKAAREALARA